MKRIVSFFGEKDSALFQMLNKKASEYALSHNFEYCWHPMKSFSEAEVIDALQNSDAGIIDIEPYGESIFSRIADKTKLLVRFGVGFDQVDLKAARRFGIAVARTTGANMNAVAEMALMMMLMCKRRINNAQKQLREGIWVKDVGHELIGATVGIIGYGAVGRRLAKLLKGFDCKIIIYDPYPKPDVIKEDGVTLVPLEELFKTADAVSIHVNYSETTHHMVNKDTLKLMKPTAVIVNTARGNVIDEEALAESLRMGRIAGAGLDVFAQEPLPLTSPLLTLENTVLTPHVSSQTEEALWNIYKSAIDICTEFFEKGTSVHILN